VIKFVGGNFASGFATSFTVPLTGLYSGIDTQARAGDLVVAMTGYAAGTGAATLGVSGVAGAEYTNVYAINQVETLDAALSVRYKYLAAEDATCLVYGEAGGRIGLVSVWRNVDPVTPLIAGQSGSQMGTNSPLPVFSGVTPTIPGSVVLAVGCGSQVPLTTQFAMGAGYTQVAGAQAAVSGTTSGIVGAIGYRYWPGYAAETPGSWTGPTDHGTTEGFVATTLVLNPVANKSVFTTSNT